MPKFPILAIVLAVAFPLRRYTQQKTVGFPCFPAPFYLPMGDLTLRILELDDRHNELLDRLAELDQHVVGILDEWTRSQTLERTEMENAAESRRAVA